MADHPVLVEDQARGNRRQKYIEVTKSAWSEERELGDNKKKEDTVVEMMQLHAEEHRIGIMDENAKPSHDDAANQCDRKERNAMMCL